jgi:hypothetical protein
LGSSSPRSSRFVPNNSFTLYSYDTGTIGGVIAMSDWLKTFGKINPTDATAHYLPTNNKSLVVRKLWVDRSCLNLTPCDRCQSCQRELSSAPCLHFLWQTSLAESGVSSLLASFSPSEWDYSWIHIGRRSWWDVVRANQVFFSIGSFVYESPISVIAGFGVVCSKPCDISSWL